MLNETTILREFSTDHEDIEFVWHRDECDRVLEVFSGAGWKLQLDNQLPVDLVEGQYHIPAGMWHRLHKGDEDLLVMITEGGHVRTPKYDKDPALKGKQSELPDGIQKGIIKKANKKNEESELDELDEKRKRKKSRKKKKQVVHDKDYSAPEGSERDKLLDKARRAYQRGDVKLAAKIRSGMEKKARSAPGYKNTPRKDTGKYAEGKIRITASQLQEAAFDAIEEAKLDEVLEQFENYIEEKRKRKKRRKKKKGKGKSAKGLSAAVKKSLDKKADRRCLTRGSVYSEFRKGLAAYLSSGSRKGMTAHQWAHARVNSANPSKSWATVKKRKKCPKKKKRGKK
jgi:hypothetical protein